MSLQGKFLDLIAVWTTTIVANIINFLGQDFINTLPLIRDLLSILSLILAIGYTVYKFLRDWRGFNPFKKK